MAKSQLPSRDCHVGLRPPRNDNSGASSFYRQPADYAGASRGVEDAAPYKVCAVGDRATKPGACMALATRKGHAASVRRQSRQRLRSERRYRRNRCVPLYRYSMRAASVAPGEACLAPTTHDWQPCSTFHSPFSTKKNPGPASGIFRQHRTIQREHSAKNDRRRPKLQLCGVALLNL